MEEKSCATKNATTHHMGELLFLWLFLWHWKDSKWRESYSWQFEINGLQIFTHKLSHSLFNWCVNVKTYIFSFHFSLPFANQTKEISNILFYFIFSFPPHSNHIRRKHFFSFPFSFLPLLLSIPLLWLQL